MSKLIIIYTDEKNKDKIVNLLEENNIPFTAFEGIYGFKSKNHKESFLFIEVESYNLPVKIEIITEDSTILEKLKDLEKQIIVMEVHLLRWYT